MVVMRPHTYTPVSAGTPPEPTIVVGCTCGWRGTATADTNANPDPGFQDWLSNHFKPFLEAGGLRGIIAHNNISRLVEGFANAGHIHWMSNIRRTIALSWGWWSIINRTARAILVLSSVYQMREAVPLVRTVLEHTLYLEALQRHGETAVDAAVREHIRNVRNIVNTGQGGPVSSGSRADFEPLEVPDPIPDAAWTQQVSAICDRLGVTNSLYLLYRVLCGQTHPSLTTADQFIGDPDREDLGIRREPNFDQDSDFLFWTGVMLVWAGQAMNRLLTQPILVEELGLAEQELGVVPVEEVSTNANFGAMNVSKERIEQIMFGESGSPAAGS